MSGFFTNRDSNTILNEINEILSENKTKELEILVGFFRLSGFFEIDKHITDIDSIKILIGIKIDRTTLNQYEELDPQEIKNEFISEEVIDLENLPYKEQIERGISILKKLIKDNKLELRIHESKKLHAKVYIFLENPKEYTGKVIIGSSNFSISGLKNNIEVNVRLDDNKHIKESHKIFEELWNEGIKITQEDISEVEKRSYISQLTPYELYMKFLMEHFQNRVYIKDEILPKGFKNLSYQTDAVTQAWEILQRHNGVFLSDVVGLGKTVIAVRIIQKFLYTVENELVLIISPPAIKSSWKRTLDDFNININRYKLESSSAEKLKKITNIEKYGLIIIDESHQFKNFTTSRYKQLEKITKTLNHKGKRKKVILVSATPLNNKPKDLENQIYLFQDKRSSTNESIKDLGSFFNSINKRYDDAINLDNTKENEAKEILDQLSKELREKILKPIMIRRTRKNIEGIKSYKDDLIKQGIKYPEKIELKELKYKFDKKTYNLFIDTILTLSDKYKLKNGKLVDKDEIDKKDEDNKVLGYFRYRVLEFLNDQKKKELADNHNVSINFYDTQANALTGLIKTLLIKRLESSFEAFKTSLENISNDLEIFIDMFKKDIKINLNFLNEYDDIDDFFANKKEKKEIIFKKNDFKKGYLKDLKKDLKKLKELNKKWKKINVDPKIDSFYDLLDKKLNKHNKIVIFTESTITAEYLGKKIKKDSKEKGKDREDILIISSKNRELLENDILENFDANYSTQKDEYKIIITTETLAEGINLHRSDVIINYDIPWNSTKLIQRIGRINRIGSPHEKIYVYNYIPTVEGEYTIKLGDKAFKKIQTFHNTLGSDSQIFLSKEEMKDVIMFNQEKDLGDEEVYFLNELRIFKEKEPDCYNILKNKTNKLRVIREGEKSSYVYLKNEGFERFYKIYNNKVELITFLIMAKILQTNKVEKNNKKVISKHFDDINLAKKDFNEELSDLNKKHIPTSSFDKTAIKYLNKLNEKYPEYSNRNEKIQFVVNKGIFENLGKDIIDIKKIKNQNPEKIFKLLDIIYRDYKIEALNSIESKKININIKTIVSETFI